jgi:hypothetical protein
MLSVPTAATGKPLPRTPTNMNNFTKPFIVWSIGDFEGWIPQEFESQEAIVEAIKKGEIRGEYAVTRLMPVKVTVDLQDCVR